MATLLGCLALFACANPSAAGAPSQIAAESPSAELASRSEASLRLMTFNIRYGTAKDGDFAWPARRQLVADLIQRENPDVLAIQEGLAFQLKELAVVLQDYTKFGQHRDGGLGGEFSGLYVRKAMATVVDSGELWLSPTPEKVASKGWDAALPRMAVWVDLKLAEDGTDRSSGNLLRVYGTHFDHRGTEARLQSAELLLAHAQSGPPAVFMGDFNAEESSAPIQVFLKSLHQSAVLLCDPGNMLGTFNGFKTADGGRRIDHILCAPGIEPIRAQIHSDQVNGIWPSDHFPVSATVRFQK
jgi:endonuclease/exonuclease/phosphatase family metal-dependent hydrolase